MSHISHVLISGRPVSMHDAEKYIFHHACMTGYDPSEVNAIWSRLTEGDRDDAEDAAAELEAIDLDGALEFILDDWDEDC